MIHYRIKLTFDRPPDFSNRGWKEVLRGAMRAAAEHWHAEMLPRHFERSARERYGYQPRTAAYQRRKIRSGRATGGVDLVYSGLSRDSALKPPRIRAYPSRARLELLVPPYIKMRPDPRGRRRAAPAMGDELTRVTYQESQELSEVMAGVIAHALAPRSFSTSVSARAPRRMTTTRVAIAAPAEMFFQSYTIICE
jgi:hypothetical protein